METLSRVRSNLTLVTTKNDEVLLCENKLVIPNTLHQRAIELAHEGHQGIVKTKQLPLEKVWFPGIDKKVQEMCKGCIPCLVSVPKTNTEPLRTTELPEVPWTRVSMDFCGPFPSGSYLMVLVDDYSRYPVVEILSNESARTVIPVLDKIFAMFGIPQKLKTDNGPPFNGNEFQKFEEDLGFKHQKVTPLWPQANGEVERFIRTLGKSIRAAHAENRVLKQELFRFLRNYRATPHTTTGVSPSELLFGRNIRVKILSIEVKTSDDSIVRETDNKRKQKMKEKLDSTRHATESKLKVGDTVLVKQNKHDKLTIPFDPKPYRINSKKGSMVKAERNNHQITRNSSFFKRVITPPSEQCPEEEEERNMHDKPSIRRSARRKKPSNLWKYFVYA
ncbi:uncharacterized protein K02A2.6-like [Pecten maximus]|uniref:uncharacterized protein K02A2.6-like n=1 Tax=Pecten maximus TaxID=6579 RepID=UPI001458D7CF|nr:uncharacterized protein K02A2.6-like [Pecten maximus]